MKVIRKSVVAPQHGELLQQLKQKKEAAVQKWKTVKQQREEQRKIQWKAYKEAHRERIREALNKIQPTTRVINQQ